MLPRLLLFLCLLSLSALGQENRGHSVRITVIDSTTLQPLDNVTIRCMPAKIRLQSDSNGLAVFDKLVVGVYTFTFSHIGCPDEIRQISISQSIELRIAMLHQVYQLNEVQIQPFQFKRPVMNLLDRTQINENSGNSLGELLSSLPGISVLQTGAGIQKAVINGLTDSRIVYVNRGSRLESQQWGQDHAPEIDPAQAGRIRLLVPARSFRMGADAIGAIVELLPIPFPESGMRKVEIGSALLLNNRLWNGFFSISGNEKKLGGLQWRASFSGRKAGNTATPDYWLFNTGFEDRTLSFETVIPLSKARIETDLSWFQATSGVFLGSQIGNISDLKAAIQQPKPLFNKDEFSYSIDRPRQEVRHWIGRVKYLSNNEELRHWQVQFTVQQNHRKEFDLARISNNPELDLTLSSFQLYGEWHSGKKFSTGLAGNFRQNTWSGSRFFIPNFRLFNPAWYANRQFSHKQFTLYSGIRFDYYFLETYRNQNGNFFSNQRNWVSTSASFQLVKNEAGGNQQQLELTMLWRPPQINELYVNGLHHGTSSFERGDPNLKQEGGIRISWQIDRSFSNGRAGFQQQLFTQFLPGFIYARPDGEPVLTIRGAFPSFTFTQTNAWLTGGNWLLFIEPIRDLRLETRFQSVLAFDLPNQTWLAPMPADRAEISARKSFSPFSRRNSAYLLLAFTRLFSQNRLPVNNTDYLLPPDGVLLTKVEAGGKFKWNGKALELNLSVNNLFNQAYRDYLNRFRYFSDEAGLNFTIRLRYHLNSQ